MPSIHVFFTPPDERGWPISSKAPLSEPRKCVFRGAWDLRTKPWAYCVITACPRRQILQAHAARRPVADCRKGLEVLALRKEPHRVKVARMTLAAIIGHLLGHALRLATTLICSLRGLLAAVLGSRGSMGGNPMRAFRLRSRVITAMLLTSCIARI